MSLRTPISERTQNGRIRRRNRASRSAEMEDGRKANPCDREGEADTLAMGSPSRGGMHPGNSHTRGPKMARKPPDHWPIIESRVRHMCQVANENGPVAAKTLIDEMMKKLEDEFEAALQDERLWTTRQYEF